jgi:carbon-monoxide dehydrogenase medium subunit
MQDFKFIRPQSLDELTLSLHETGGQIIAGGTDIIPQMRHNLFPAKVLLDASRIGELMFIEERGDQIVLGALTTLQEIASSSLLQSANPALVAAAETVGCRQTRNRGTLGGNIANASPAADTVPPLLIFNAEVRLMHMNGERTLPLAEFLRGPGETQLGSGELIHSVAFKRLSGVWGASFLKLGKRNGMAISVVNAASALVLDASGMVKDARLALGSVAPKVVRCTKAEEILVGHAPTQKIIKQAAEAVIEDISPISDVRATRDYRCHAAVVLTRRVLEQSAADAKGRLT